MTDKQQKSDRNRDFVSNKSPRGANNKGGASVVGNSQEMNAYLKALEQYKQKISAMVEKIIKTVDASADEEHTKNVLRREKTSGKPSKMECGVVLVVETPIVHDVGDIVNDAFRDYMCRELGGNNRKLYDSPEFKEHLSLIEDIRRAEKDVMELQERLLRIGGDGVGLKTRNVENYSLLCPRELADDCADDCVDYYCAYERRKQDGDDGRKRTVYGIHGELRRLRLRLNRERPRLDVQCREPGDIARKRPATERPEHTGPSVNTNVVHFGSFRLDGIYKKTLKITNTGKRAARFGFSTRGRRSSGAFDYELEPTHAIAPGLSAKLTVTFKCTSMEDAYEKITITGPVKGGTDIFVSAENAIPILKYITQSYHTEPVSKMSSTPSWSSSSVFECNACLVGATKTIAIAVKNVGRTAKFVCVSEDVWYTKPVQDVEWKETMNLGAFEIAPSMFEINRGQLMALNVTFKPTSPSFYCSRFIIVSDNMCAQEVNVFGDGQMFGCDRNVRLEGRKLCATGPASYVLDMGKIGEVVQNVYVYAKNKSRIECPYRWIINHTIDDPGFQNAKVNFNIHPSTGFLDKVSKTMFRVECGVTDEIVDEQLTGKYRVTATLMIDDVPKESISEQNTFFEEQEDGSELLSIRVAEMEVISEYKGKEHNVSSLRTDPVILDLNWYKLEIGECVTQTTVDFINTGPRPLRVSRTPGEDDATGWASVVPENFELVDRVTVVVTVRPRVPGRLRGSLTFSAVDEDGGGRLQRTTVYVRGTAEPVAPDVRHRPAVTPLRDVVYAGVPAEPYAVEFRVLSAVPFGVQRRLYGLDETGELRALRGGATSFGPFRGGCATATWTFPTPVATEATSGMVLCQLAEWSFAGSTKTVRTQAVTCVKRPDVRLNADAITIDRSLYRGISHSHKGIRLFNNTRHDFAYSWGEPVGSDANDVHCAFNPANGTVDGNASVEFELVVTPRKSGLLDKFWLPCFVQCDALEPRQIHVKCLVKEFSATIAYVDAYARRQNVTWKDDSNQWITIDDSFEGIDQTESADCLESGDSSSFSTTTTKCSNDFDKEDSRECEIKPEDQKPAKWPIVKRQRRDMPLRSPVERFGRASNDDYRHPIMAFEDVECNSAVKQHVTVRNTTDISFRVKMNVNNFDYNSTLNRVNHARSRERAERASAAGKRCWIWIDKDDEVLCGQDELEVSVWALATTWGRYEDTLTIELHVDNDVLPAVRIPLVVHAVTNPLEFPLAADVRRPIVNFSLYSADSEHRLQILNTSEIPIQVTWRIYHENQENRPFGVIFDTFTPNSPSPWTFRIDRYYGLETPRYFMIKPVVLKLAPKEQGYVIFYLDRTKEKSIHRDKNNMVYGKAVGTVTSLEPSGNHCIRKDGFEIRPTVVRLCSETRHSIQPKLVLREQDNIFQVWATQIYDSRSPPSHSTTRIFTLLNLLQYPATISFKINSPFFIKSLRSLRCGVCAGNAKILLFYEDLLEIELQVHINMKSMHAPKMPKKISSRKSVMVEHLYAACENSYFKNQMVAPFELHIYFPILKLSTRYINFGEVVVGETKSIDVMLSSYPGPERFIARSEDEVFAISPADGVVSYTPISLAISFRPKADVWYSNKIEMSTTIPMDIINLKVSGFGIK